MLDEANRSGIYKHPGDGRDYPVVQIFTVAQILNRERPKIPASSIPYFQAERRAADKSVDGLF